MINDDFDIRFNRQNGGDILAEAFEIAFGEFKKSYVHLI